MEINLCMFRRLVFISTLRVGLPLDLLTTKIRRTAAADYLAPSRLYRLISLRLLPFLSCHSLQLHVSAALFSPHPAHAFCSVFPHRTSQSSCSAQARKFSVLASAAGDDKRVGGAALLNLSFTFASVVIESDHFL